MRLKKEKCGSWAGVADRDAVAEEAAPVPAMVDIGPGDVACLRVI